MDAGKLEEALELTIRLWVGGPRRSPDAVPAELRERVRAMQRRAYEVVLAAYEEEPHPRPVAWAEPPSQERLGEISAPTLVLVGHEDLDEMLAISRDLAREIRGARLAELAGVAHIPGLERPDEFNRIVLDFLGEVPPSPRTSRFPYRKEVSMGFLDKLLGREGKEEKAEQGAESAESRIESEADRREEDVAEARDTAPRNPPPGTG